MFHQFIFSFILAMMNCLYCTSDIAEVDQHYVVSNLGPEIVFVFEQNFLSHQDGEVNDGVLCSQCFDRTIVAISTIRHSLGMSIISSNAMTQ